MLHWNGTSWAKVWPTNVNPSLTSNVLRGVSGSSATDVWAVGTYVDNTTGADRTLTLHWNGLGWSRVASANVGALDNALYGVSATSPTDAWAVGDYCDSIKGCYRSLTLHWDGTSWSSIVNQTEFWPSSNSAYGVSAWSPTNVWVVGEFRSPPSHRSGYAMHWTGASWPEGYAGYAATYRGVSAWSDSDNWTVGYSDRSLTLGEPVILHGFGFPGASVGAARFPISSSTSLGGAMLNAVSAVSPSEAWAVGVTRDYQTLIVHWDGVTWTAV